MPSIGAGTGTRLWNPLDGNVGAELAVWWDAADISTISSAAVVTAWRDKRSGLVAIQGGFGSAPTTGTRQINGLNVLDFSGTAQTLKCDAWSMVHPFTMLAVYKLDNAGFGRVWDSQGTTRTLLNANANQTGIYTGGAYNIGANSVNLINHIAVFGKSIQHVDQTVYSNSSPTTATATQILIGTDNGSVIDGAICELVFWRGEMPLQGLVKIGNYAASRWGCQNVARTASPPLVFT